MTEKETAEQFNAEQIQSAAARAHTLLVTALGTRAAPTLAEVAASIGTALEAAQEYPDQDYFLGHGLLVQVDRNARPWPTFEVFVTATPRLFRRPPK